MYVICWIVVLLLRLFCFVRPLRLFFSGVSGKEFGGAGKCHCNEKLDLARGTLFFFLLLSKFWKNVSNT